MVKYKALTDVPSSVSENNQFFLCTVTGRIPFFRDLTVIFLAISVNIQIAEFRGAVFCLNIMSLFLKMNVFISQNECLYLENECPRFLCNISEGKQYFSNFCSCCIPIPYKALVQTHLTLILHPPPITHPSRIIRTLSPTSKWCP